MSILYADDDQDELDFFCEALKAVDNSIICMTAQDGEEALAILKTIIPSFIFLDFNMPRKNGKECLIEIKQNKRLINIPVIIYTTSTHRSMVEELNLLGACKLLPKDGNLSQLSNALRIILKTSNQEASYFL